MRDGVTYYPPNSTFSVAQGYRIYVLGDFYREGK